MADLSFEPRHITPEPLLIAITLYCFLGRRYGFYPQRIHIFIIATVRSLKKTLPSLDMFLFFCLSLLVIYHIFLFFIPSNFY